MLVAASAFCACMAAGSLSRNIAKLSTLKPKDRAVPGADTQRR
jgi:hypothetical protein